MLKETPKSLQLYFSIVSVFSLLSGIAAASQSKGSLVVIVLSAASMGFGLLFGYVSLRFSDLLQYRPAFIKNVLTANFALSILIFLLSLTGGFQPGPLFRLGIATLIYFYLVKSVARLSAESSAKNA